MMGDRSEERILPANAGAVSDMSQTTLSGLPAVRHIRRVGVGSAFKVGALVSALLIAVFGIFFVVLPSLIGASLLGALGGNGAGGFGLVTGLLIYFGLIVFYGLLGGIFGALYAFFYNLVARWVGGLRIEVTGE